MQNRTHIMPRKLVRASLALLRENFQAADLGSLSPGHYMRPMDPHAHIKRVKRRLRARQRAYSTHCTYTGSLWRASCPRERRRSSYCSPAWFIWWVLHSFVRAYLYLPACAARGCAKMLRQLADAEKSCTARGFCLIIHTQALVWASKRECTEERSDCGAGMRKWRERCGIIMVSWRLLLHFL